MKSPLLLLAVASLSLGAAACGGSIKRGGTAAPTPSSTAATVGAPPTHGYPAPGYVSSDYDSDDYTTEAHYGDADSDDNGKPKDRDNDSDNTSGSYYDGDDRSVRASGRAAGALDRQAVTGLVERYYAAAAAEDGATACALLGSLLRSTIPERLGQGPPSSPPYSRGKTCATIMSEVFAHFHPQLAAYVASSLEVTGVRLLEGGRGLAVLGFRTLPGREIEVAREHGTWRMAALLDGELP